MKLFKVCLFFILLFFLSVLVYLTRYDAIESDVSILYVMLLEISVVIITASICICYSIEKTLQEKKRTSILRPPILVYFCSVDEEKTQFSVLLHDRIIIGRNSSKTHIAYPHNILIEEQHCELSYIEGNMYIEDLHSRSGTLLNNERITSKVPIQSGDIITLGEIKLKIIWSIEV